MSLHDYFMWRLAIGGSVLVVLLVAGFPAWNHRRKFFASARKNRRSK